ncbi:uncharacterized protein [Miscanthus floridulus]|uniref:uncharacterized protein n=1 Tax=Miscanthus floridulus TaxID=154761 RepID=UPI00345927B2
MAGILRSVPQELWNALTVRRTAKEAWDAIKILRVGDERVRDATAQQLRRDFGNLAFKDGETVGDFGVRITTLATNLRTLGDNISESEVVKKLLQVVPEKLSQAAVSIEMFCNLRTISIEDVIRVFEDRGKQKSVTDAMGRLLLTEEDWEARRKARRDQDSSGRSAASSSDGKKRGQRGQGRGRGKGVGGSTSHDGKQAEPNSGKATRADQCKRCGKYGHWAKDCRSKPKAEAHVAQAEEDAEPALLMARATVVPNPVPDPHGAATTPTAGAPPPSLSWRARSSPSWTATPSATTGCGTSTVELRTTCPAAATPSSTSTRRFVAFVKFGDGSEVAIEGSGTVLFEGKTGEHLPLMGVYFIPRLTTNIVSLGQLDEGGCDVHAKHGVLRVHDENGRLIVRVKRSANRLYLLRVKIARPLCLSARSTNSAVALA